VNFWKLLEHRRATTGVSAHKSQNC